MRRALPLLFVLLALARAEDDRPNRRVSDPKLQTEINKAIDAGVAYLKRVQAKDGSWPFVTDGGKSPQGEHYDGGITALALYAMAASRVPSDDPSIVHGLRWTQRHRVPYGTSGSRGTYCASLLVLALTRIDADRYRSRIETLAGRLVAGQLKSDMWTYQLQGRTSRGAARRGGRGRGPGGQAQPPRMPGDNSNSQFAVLALWAAMTLADVEVPVRTWQRVEQLYRRTQLRNGEWPYSTTTTGGFRGGSPTMTAAGLVSYAYASAALHGGAPALPDARATSIARKGLAAFLRGPQPFQNYYFVYSLERVGTVLGLPEEKWYVDGARRLIRAQKKDGRWTPPHRRSLGDGPSVYETSLALLFLSRATAYTITPGGDSRPAGRQATTRGGDKTPASIERLFRDYVQLGADGRLRKRAEFGRAGRESVGLFVRKLSSSDVAVRRAARELLDALVERRFLFEPDRPRSERKLMIVPIENFWRREGHRLRWDAKRGLFVLGE